MINKNPGAAMAGIGTSVVISPNPGASPVLHLLRRRRDNGAGTDIDHINDDNRLCHFDRMLKRPHWAAVRVLLIVTIRRRS